MVVFIVVSHQLHPVLSLQGEKEKDRVIKKAVTTCILGTENNIHVRETRKQCAIRGKPEANSSRS